MKNILLAITAILVGFTALSQKKDKDQKVSSGIEANLVSGLKFRLVGPALTSGRISDLAVDPTNADTWYVTAASGGVWKTINHGTTFNPILIAMAPTLLVA